MERGGGEGQLWERGEDRKSEVEGSKKETNVGKRRRDEEGRSKGIKKGLNFFTQGGKKEKNH